jgi:hypothetical protein
MAGGQRRTAPPVAYDGQEEVLKDSQDNLYELHGCDADEDDLEFEVVWRIPKVPGRTDHGTLQPGDDSDPARGTTRPIPVTSDRIASISVSRTAPFGVNRLYSPST